MAASYTKSKNRKEYGHFVNIPHAVLEHVNFTTLSSKARALLIDICYQIRFDKDGVKNNGDLCAAWGFMKKRGWGSAGTLHAAQKELHEHGLIIKTRQGWKKKCSLYGLSWLPINASEKYDSGISETKVAPGTWKKIR